MTDLQGAIGLVQLERLDGLLKQRRRMAADLSAALECVPWLRLPKVPAGYEHSWQSYVAVVTDERPGFRERVMERLLQRGGPVPARHPLGGWARLLPRGTRDGPMPVPGFDDAGRPLTRAAAPQLHDRWRLRVRRGCAEELVMDRVGGRHAQGRRCHPRRHCAGGV